MTKSDQKKYTQAQNHLIKALEILKSFDEYTLCETDHFINKDGDVCYFDVRGKIESINLIVDNLV